jgi:hypothetical protein
MGNDDKFGGLLDTPLIPPGLNGEGEQTIEVDRYRLMQKLQVDSPEDPGADETQSRIVIHESELAAAAEQPRATVPVNQIPKHIVQLDPATQEHAVPADILRKVQNSLAEESEEDDPGATARVSSSIPGLPVRGPDGRYSFEAEVMRDGTIRLPKALLEIGIFREGMTLSIAAKPSED